MKIDFLNRDKRKKTEIFILNMIILFFIFRMAFPILKYPFIILLGSSIFNITIYYRKDLIHKSKQFIKDYSIILIIYLILCFSFFISSKMYLIVFKDLMNALLLLCIFFLYTVTVNKKSELSFLISSLLYLIIFFGVLISFNITLDILDVFTKTEYQGVPFKKNIIDYNFILLPVFFSIAAIFYLFINKNKLFLQGILYSVFIFSILLSGSKRGVILLIITFILICFVQLYLFLKKDVFFRKIKFQFFSYFFSFFFVSLSMYLFFTYTSHDFKDKTLNLIGTKNIIKVKSNISTKLYRYCSYFQDLNAVDFHRTIWNTSINSRDPDSGWGTNMHKTIFPLYGENVEIVPKDSKGYLLDSNCNVVTWNGNTYSSTEYFNANIEQGDSVQASVYCFVSNDFNGTRALITLADKEGKFVASCNYDQTKKNTWQKLVVAKKFDDNKISVLLFVSKLGVTNFSSLKGYVIFAHPEYKIITKRKNDTLLLTKNQELDSLIINKAILFPIPQFLFKLSSAFSNNELIRRLTLSFVNEDTTYYPYKSNLKIDFSENTYAKDRISRWEFAIEIYRKEYSWSEKIFGGGFDFLNWYGYCFYKDQTKSDYPHNPFLHVLLYSGLIGLGLYIFLMYKVFYYYIKYSKEYYIFFIFFLFTFFFTFFSGGIPFDPPIMGFFVILPFFLHSVHKRDAEKQIENDNKEKQLVELNEDIIN